ncbi:MAG: DnaA regulatory inactivator Hda [Gammaproteobacteria bacterium]|nr:DnaA regulatory inactivator Hda [Gammaproteobacteria bacterium]
MSRQLALPVTLRDAAGFENFHAAPTSVAGQALALLRDQFPPGTLVCLWGGPGTGKSHLARASCRHYTNALYLPLGALRDSDPEDVFADLDSLDLLALDELDAVAGRDDWELALFGLHNRLLERGGRLLVTARVPPRELPLRLPDLRSRLIAGYGFGLPDHDDGQCLEILRFRAARLGLLLGPDAGRYLLHRAPRDLASLMDCLDRLDHAALAHQRQLTLPFIKQVFGW